MASSVAQNYIKYGWHETGATALEEKIIDYCILCVKQDPRKGHIEFKEIPSNTKYLKRLVKQVYNKEAENVEIVLALVDLVHDLEQKLFMIWALSDQIVLNDDSIGAKRCLSKLKVFENSTSGAGIFSEFDLWQVKLLGHQLNRLQYTNSLTDYSASSNSSVSTTMKAFENKLSDLAAKNSTSLASFERKMSSLEHSMNEMKADLKSISLQRSLGIFHGKKFRMFWANTKNTRSLLSRKCGNIFNIPFNTEVLWTQLIVNNSEKLLGDLWILEKYPNPVEDTYFLKNVTYNGYLRTVDEHISGTKHQKVTLSEEKMDTAQFQWKICYSGNDRFYIYSDMNQGTNLCSYLFKNSTPEEKAYMCVTSEIKTQWEIEIVD